MDHSEAIAASSTTSQSLGIGPALHPVWDDDSLQSLPQTHSSSRPLPHPLAGLSWIHLALLVLTLLTTTMMGARFMSNFSQGLAPFVSDDDLFPFTWMISHPRLFWTGLPFSLTLLTILLAHEFGHFLRCRYHRIPASWPYLLPAPTLSGTAGAVIRIRGFIPTRAILLDIGISGPIAGYITLIPATIAGLLLSRPAAAAPHGQPVGFIHLYSPCTMRIAYRVLRLFDPALVPFHRLLWHPVLLACWVGLFITSLNLIPAGQLDGGHILYACFPRIHRYVTWAVVALLTAASLRLWGGWLLWAVILLLPAMRHPRVPAWPPLPAPARWLALLALAIFLLTFMAAPFTGQSVLDLIHPL